MAKLIKFSLTLCDVEGHQRVSRGQVDGTEVSHGLMNWFGDEDDTTHTDNATLSIDGQLPIVMNGDGWREIESEGVLNDLILIAIHWRAAAEELIKLAERGGPYYQAEVRRDSEETKLVFATTRNQSKLIDLADTSHVTTAWKATGADVGEAPFFSDDSDDSEDIEEISLSEIAEKILKDLRESHAEKLADTDGRNALVAKIEDPVIVYLEAYSIDRDADGPDMATLEVTQEFCNQIVSLSKSCGELGVLRIIAPGEPNEWNGPEMDESDILSASVLVVTPLDFWFEDRLSGFLSDETRIETRAVSIDGLLQCVSDYEGDGPLLFGEDMDRLRECVDREKESTEALAG